MKLFCNLALAICLWTSVQAATDDDEAAILAKIAEIDGIDLRIRGATLNEAYPDLFAVACVETHNKTIPFAECTSAQICMSGEVHQKTSVPTFIVDERGNSFRCKLVGPYPVSDYLQVYLYQKSSGANKPLGLFVDQIHAMITAKDPKAPHQTPILNGTKQIGEFNLGIDFGLN